MRLRRGDPGRDQGRCGMTCDGKTMSVTLSELQIHAGGERGLKRIRGLDIAEDWLAFFFKHHAREWSERLPGFISIALVTEGSR